MPPAITFPKIPATFIAASFAVVKIILWIATRITRHIRFGKMWSVPFFLLQPAAPTQGGLNCTGRNPLIEPGSAVQTTGATSEKCGLSPFSPFFSSLTPLISLKGSWPFIGERIEIRVLFYKLQHYTFFKFRSY